MDITTDSKAKTTSEARLIEQVTAAAKYIISKDFENQTNSCNSDYKGDNHTNIIDPFQERISTNIKVTYTSRRRNQFHALKDTFWKLNWLESNKKI